MLGNKEHAITESKLRLMWSRMLKVARFDSKTFLELKEDGKATEQGVAIVALAGVSLGLGTALINATESGVFSATGLLLGGLLGVITAISAALVWSMTTFLIGTKLFRGYTSYWGLVRPLFYSYSPALLFILIAIPVFPIRQAAGAIVGGWTVIAGVFAVKNAMGFSNERSMLTFVVGALILSLLASFFLSF